MVLGQVYSYILAWAIVAFSAACLIGYGFQRLSKLRSSVASGESFFTWKAAVYCIIAGLSLT